MATALDDARTEVTTAEVRAWAIRRGFDIGRRGHLGQPIIDAFNRAHRRKVAVSRNPMVKVEETDL